jgi:hypothetical protein
MSDPKLVQAVLGEVWEVDDSDPEWLDVRGESIVSFGTSLTKPHQDYERARQAALGHRALQHLAANHYEDCTAHGDCPLCAIVTELREGAK